jgi:hypothetical protein
MTNHGSRTEIDAEDVVRETTAPRRPPSPATVDARYIADLYDRLEDAGNGYLFSATDFFFAGSTGIRDDSHLACPGAFSSNRSGKRPHFLQGRHDSGIPCIVDAHGHVRLASSREWTSTCGRTVEKTAPLSNGADYPACLGGDRHSGGRGSSRARRATVCERRSSD